MNDIFKALNDLERKIVAVQPARRHYFHDDLHRLINAVDRAGGPVPRRLRTLQSALADEAIEAQFDNLPV